MTVARVPPRALFRRAMIVSLLAGATFGPAAWAQNASPPDGLETRFRPQPICFPLNAPPLGRPVTKLSVYLRTNAPSELSNYLNEPFYAPLSSRLMQKEFPEKIRHHLDAFAAERAALLTELRAEIVRTRPLPHAERRAAFVALAKRQASRLTALEANADQLRAECITSDNDWSALRNWRLGGTGERGDSPMEIGCVMRAYAYYQTGLSPAQRRLLREITIEIVAGAEDTTAAVAAQPFVFFMPEMTRVLFPESVSDDVAKKVALFQTKKSVIKKELFDAVMAGESAAFPFMRTNALRTLAGKQATRFTELETLADEIREGIVGMPELAPSAARSPLSPALTQRTVAVAEERTALMRDSRSKIDAIINRVADTLPVRFGYSLGNEGITVQPMPRYYAGRRISLDDLTRVGVEHRTRNEELTREYEQLRADISQTLGPKATELAVDNALDGVVRAYTAQENELAYAEYRIATFEPGLSPAQRRLLFEGALEKLNLPLPHSEYQPIYRPDSW